ncbi:PREDICTED: ribonuclease H2 subunit A-like isoform X4 [Populus euphratica]|uniref:Ribonuclease n=1 Tax=Populus euphratica TaxID=75702 RepID=A0AAJ6TQ00_POPEU|nr:PREDICTED: ribonuclease H2 subunit A-like isoform X4 [Populus euphratica]XP_011024196.1 PREDICTED: ribonuclease H2 subunit A-like isoform X4 [Populus euphratica]
MGIDEAEPMVYGCLCCACSYEKTLYPQLCRNKINLNEISQDSASGLANRVLNMGVLLTEIYVDTVGDPDKYRIKLSESFPFVKFVVAKKAGSLYPVVSGAIIVAKVVISHPFDSLNLFLPICLSSVQPRRLQEIGPCEDGYLMKQLKTWLGILDLDTLELGWNKHEHSVFGFPTLFRFSWGTCTPYSKNMVDVLGQLSVLSLLSHSNTLLLQLHHCAA